MRSVDRLQETTTTSSWLPSSSLPSSLPRSSPPFPSVFPSRAPRRRAPDLGASATREPNIEGRCEESRGIPGEPRTRRLSEATRVRGESTRGKRCGGDPRHRLRRDVGCRAGERSARVKKEGDAWERPLMSVLAWLRPSAIDRIDRYFFFAAFFLVAFFFAMLDHLLSRSISRAALRTATNMREMQVRVKTQS